VIFNGPMPSTRVLIAEDFAPFRELLHSILQETTELQLVGEASNGRQVLRLAEQLQPDLILLDIGLPELNGLRAAQRIRRISPNSKILFVSQESSVDVVQEALRLSQGYLLKADVASELLIAVDVVLEGKQQFVSASLNFPAVSNSVRCIGESRPPLGNTNRSPMHDLVSCRDDASFVVHFVRFIEAALKVGNPVIVIATREHRRSVLQSLEARGWDMPAAVQEGTYISLDVYDVLSGFMVNDLPDGS
jgi:CheY-like chemotaxis protein